MVDPVCHQTTVRVRCGARLHFGLFDTQSPFGGLGMMIDQPATEVLIRPAAAWDAGTVDNQRINEIAQRLLQYSQPAGSPPIDPLHTLPRCSVTVTQQPAVHSGLGSGTQLALAVAAGLARFCGQQRTADELIQQVAARGKRSAVGSLGFFHGGLLSESGGELPYSDTRWWSRQSVPEAWHAVLIRPRDHQPAISGESERQAFATLPPADSAHKQQLHQLAAQIQTAVTNGDFSAFAAPLTQFNRLSGQLFAAAQGGCYNGPQVTRLIDTVKSAGAVAYGQSSWGPTVFVICATPTDAQSLAAAMPPDTSVQIVRPLLSAAEISSNPVLPADP